MSLSTGTIYMKKKKQNKKYMELNQKKVGLTKGSSKTKKNHPNAEGRDYKKNLQIFLTKYRSQHTV